MRNKNGDEKEYPYTEIIGNWKYEHEYPGLYYKTNLETGDTWTVDVNIGDFITEDEIEDQLDEERNLK